MLNGLVVILIFASVVGASFDRPTLSFWLDLELERVKEFHPSITDDPFRGLCDRPYSTYCIYRRNSRSWCAVVPNEITILVDPGFFRREIPIEAVNNSEEVYFNVVKQSIGSAYLSSIVKTFISIGGESMRITWHSPTSIRILIIDDHFVLSFGKYQRQDRQIIVRFIERERLSLDS